MRRTRPREDIGVTQGLFRFPIRPAIKSRASDDELISEFRPFPNISLRRPRPTVLVQSTAAGVVGGATVAQGMNACDEFVRR